MKGKMKFSWRTKPLGCYFNKGYRYEEIGYQGKRMMISLSGHMDTQRQTVLELVACRRKEFFLDYVSIRARPILGTQESNTLLHDPIAHSFSHNFDSFLQHRCVLPHDLTCSLVLSLQPRDTFVFFLQTILITPTTHQPKRRMTTSAAGPLGIKADQLT
ncbi:hypothetical protein HKD37_05G013491 [Glycine soja]